MPLSCAFCCLWRLNSVVWPIFQILSCYDPLNHWSGLGNVKMLYAFQMWSCTRAYSYFKCFNQRQQDYDNNGRTASGGEGDASTGSPGTPVTPGILSSALSSFFESSNTPIYLIISVAILYLIINRDLRIFSSRNTRMWPKSLRLSLGQWLISSFDRQTMETSSRTMQCFCSELTHWSTYCL